MNNYKKKLEEKDKENSIIEQLKYKLETYQSND